MGPEFGDQPKDLGEYRSRNGDLSHLKRDIAAVTDDLCANLELCRIVADLKEKGVSLLILSIALDTATAAGKLMLNFLGAVAEFETAIMRERQREGIERAKRDGKYKGRKATAGAKTDVVRQLRTKGLGASAIAAQLGISRASVYRMIGWAIRPFSGASATSSMRLTTAGTRH